ncbi:MAG: hypothetical protein JWO09_3461 [Bacteroidetes bacterium]|nr:hypothetical protein [Bacteroidota bacterium]
MICQFGFSLWGKSIENCIIKEQKDGQVPSFFISAPGISPEAAGLIIGVLFVYEYKKRSGSMNA